VHHRDRIYDSRVDLRPEREAELNALASGDAWCVLNADGTIKYASASIQAVTGYTVEQYTAMEPIELVHPADQRALRHLWFDLAVAPGKSQTLELRTRRADGSYVWVEITNTNLTTDPRVGGFLSCFSDISERRGRPAPDLEDGRLEHLLSASPDVIASLALDATVTWIANPVREMLGLAREDMVGRSAFDFVHPDDLELAVERFTGAVASKGQVEPVILRLAHADGSWPPIEIAGASVLDRDGEITDVILNLRDVRWRVDALEAVASSERLFRTLAQSSPIGIYQSLNADGCVYVNDRWSEITGLPFDQAKGWGWRSMLEPEDADQLGSPENPAPFDDRPVSFEIRLVRPDGERRWARVQSGPLRDSDGQFIGSVGTLEDVTDRHRSQRDMQRLTDIFEATEDFVGICDTDGVLLYINAAAKRLFGIHPDSPPGGLTTRDVFPPSVVERLTAEIRPQAERDGRWTGELALARPDGSSMPVAAQILVHPGLPGEDAFLSATLHDISERKAFEHRLAHQATHDPLTGLPNRLLLIDRLEGALARARRHNRRVAVLFLDIDHFKVVNDSLGHGLGDRLLIAIAERLTVALRPGDTVARFGGDEFVVLCEDLVSQQDAIAVAERVDDAVSGPFVIDETEVFVGVSIGIALPDNVDADPETLIRDADAAMYRAKDRGRARWELFDNAMRASAVDRLDIENALRRALERRELRVFYQPLIDLDTGVIDGVEALLRWEHPERGLLLPGDFITVAEETGLIVPIGSWVLDQACRQAQRWQAAADDARPLRVSVNISGRQLGHPRLVDDVAAIMADTGIDPSDVELEITESVLMDDVDMSEETLEQLHRLGVKLAVDDFGTGYSSLSYLRRFPVDVLKVDRSFVDGLGEDPNDSAIVTAIVTLAHTLGLSAVAEGVESALQLAELRMLGCDRAQGYYIARPATGHEVGEMLAASPRW
jgi:diguanylate cyclase (GGDEF)-like protein/PAS domain S-box-containing protein